MSKLVHFSLSAVASRVALLAVCLVACASSALAVDAPSDPGAGKKVNINQASATQIAYLPRVGNKVAERIVERRKAHGTYAQVEELMEVKGVGERLFNELKPYVTLSGPTTLTAKVRGSGAGSHSAASGSSRRSSHASRPVPASSQKAPANAAPEGSGR